MLINCVAYENGHKLADIPVAQISEYLKRARSAGLTWEQARTLDDATVEQRLFRIVGRNEPARRAPEKEMGTPEPCAPARP